MEKFRKEIEDEVKGLTFISMDGQTQAACNWSLDWDLFDPKNEEEDVNRLIRDIRLSEIFWYSEFSRLGIERLRIEEELKSSKDSHDARRSAIMARARNENQSKQAWREGYKYGCLWTILDGIRFYKEHGKIMEYWSVPKTINN